MICARLWTRQLILRTSHPLLAASALTLLDHPSIRNYLARAALLFHTRRDNRTVRMFLPRVITLTAFESLVARSRALYIISIHTSGFTVLIGARAVYEPFWTRYLRPSVLLLEVQCPARGVIMCRIIMQMPARWNMYRRN